MPLYYPDERFENLKVSNRRLGVRAERVGVKDGRLFGKTDASKDELAIGYL